MITRKYRDGLAKMPAWKENTKKTKYCCKEKENTDLHNRHLSMRNGEGHSITRRIKLSKLKAGLSLF